MDANFENVARCIALIASIVFALLPLDQSRVRAVWAKVVLLTVGIVGVLVTGAESLLVLHWIVPSKDAMRTIHQAKVALCGFAVGLILALILSKQLLGTKRMCLATSNSGIASDHTEAS